MPLPNNSTKAKRLLASHSGLLIEFFFYQRFVFCDCILCVRYFLGKIDISLPEPGDPASPFDLLFEFFSFVSCVFYVLDFLGDIGIFPLGPGCPTSSFDLLFEFCVLSFSSYLFYNVLDFLGYIGISPLRPGCPVGPFDLLFERLQVGFF